VEGSVFGAISLCFFVCVWNISENRWVDLRQIHMENMFGPSLWQVRGQRSRSPRTKNGLFCPFRWPACSLCSV